MSRHRRIARRMQTRKVGLALGSILQPGGARGRNGEPAHSPARAEDGMQRDTDSGAEAASRFGYRERRPGPVSRRRVVRFGRGTQRREHRSTKAGDSPATVAQEKDREIRESSEARFVLTAGT